MSKPTTLRLDKIQVEDNVRAHIDEKGLDDLGQSIVTSGVLQPLIVAPNGSDGTYVLVSGHRRRAAIERAIADGQLHPDFEIPVTVRTEAKDPDDRVVVQLIENLQREDISLVDEARGYARLKEQGMAQKDISTSVGRSESHVSKRLSLLKLPDDVLTRVEKGEIPVEAAIELPKLPPEEARSLSKQGAQLTVRQVKAAISHQTDAKRKQKVRADLEKAGITVFDYHSAREACPKGKVVREGKGVSKVADLPKRLAGVFYRDYATDEELVPVTFVKADAKLSKEEAQRQAEREAEDQRREQERAELLASIDSFVESPPPAAQLLELLMRTGTVSTLSTFVSSKDEELASEGRDLSDWLLAGEASSVEVRKVAATKVIAQIYNVITLYGTSSGELESLIALCEKAKIEFPSRTQEKVLDRLAQLWENDARIAELAEEQAIAEAEAQAEAEAAQEAGGDAAEGPENADETEDTPPSEDTDG